MKDIVTYLNESVVPGVVFLKTGLWSKITTGREYWDMNISLRVMTDEKFEKFFNKVIKTKFVKNCKKDGLSISVDYLNSISCSFKGVYESNVDVFFKHFYEMITSEGYELKSEHVYELFNDSGIRPEIVQILIDENNIK